MKRALVMAALLTACSDPTGPDYPNAEVINASVSWTIIDAYFAECGTREWGFDRLTGHVPAGGTAVVPLTPGCWDAQLLVEHSDGRRTNAQWAGLELGRRTLVKLRVTE